MAKSAYVIAGVGGLVVAIAIAAVLVLGNVTPEPMTSNTEPDVTPEPMTSNTEPDVESEQLMLDERIVVYASFYPYYELTKNVAGDHAIVHQYIPPNVEAHDWEPMASDLLLLKDANLFVYNGLGMEPYVDQLIDSGEFSNVTFVKVSEGIPVMKPDTHEDEDEHAEDEHANDEHAEDEHANDEHAEDEHANDEHAEDEHANDEHAEDEHGHDHHITEFDPHIWLDPILVKSQINNIRDALTEADPVNAVHYEQNAAVYSAEFDAFDLKVKESLTSCKHDTFVPFHNAFEYFAQRYDLNSFPLSGMSPHSEATATDIAEFVDFVKDKEIKIVFTEDLVNTRLAQVVADEADAELLTFSALEALTAEEVAAGVSLLDKMNENLSHLRIALECQ